MRNKGKKILNALLKTEYPADLKVGIWMLFPPFFLSVRSVLTFSYITYTPTVLSVGHVCLSVLDRNICENSSHLKMFAYPEHGAETFDAK